MVSRRARAKAEAGTGLTKAEACKILQVAPTADEELITQAYWHLASKLRVHAPRDPEARQQLDQLNRAYLVLNPGRGEAPLSKEIPPMQERPPLAEEFMAWLRRLIGEIAARWPERTTEVAVITATTALLAFLALSAGASPFWTLLAAGVAALTIWAPWRRT